jgi:hypothetical protein
VYHPPSDPAPAGGATTTRKKQAALCEFSYCAACFSPGARPAKGQVRNRQLTVSGSQKEDTFSTSACIFLHFSIFCKEKSYQKDETKAISGYAARKNNIKRLSFASPSINFLLTHLVPAYQI